MVSVSPSLRKMNAATLLKPTNFLDAALALVAAGFSVLPIRGMKYAGGDTEEQKRKDAKKPIIKWEAYQERKPTDREVEEWFRKNPHANIGIVTGTVSGELFVLDLDNPELAKRTLLPLIPDSLVFPISRTPSGGEHWFFRCDDATPRNTVKPELGFDIRANGGYVVAPPSVIAGTQGYSWQVSVFDVAVPALPQALHDFLLSHAVGSKEFAVKGVVGGNLVESRGGDDIVTTMFSDGRRDNDLFHAANCLHKGGMPETEVFQVLRTIAKSWGEDHDVKWFNDKIISVLSRSERKDKVLADAVREWVLSSSGVILSSDVVRDLGLSSGVVKNGDLSSNVVMRRDRQNVSKILTRMCDEGIIERTGNKNGMFRKIDDRAEDIDFLSGDDTPLSIAWPFEIERLVHTYQKQIILVAGSSNSGKTAFTLNFVKQNMAKHRIHYFSSEMGKTELKSRLNKFDIPMESWKQCSWKERSSNFADVIRRDDINIIDFLELHTDFFMVGQLIKDMFDKLRKGICIIALQKNAGRDHGLGGERSIEKARLYLAMDSGKIKIVKGKNWAQEGCNPNGLERKFRLVQGCRFIPDTGWEK